MYSQTLKSRCQLHQRIEISRFHAFLGICRNGSVTILLPGCILSFLDENTVHLIDGPVKFAIQNQRDENVLHVVDRNVVEIASDPRQTDTSVRPNIAHDDLGADRAEKIGHVLADELIVEYSTLVLLRQMSRAYKKRDELGQTTHLLENLFELLDVVVVECLNEVRHGGDLGIVTVGTRLVRVEGVDTACVEHASHDEVVETAKTRAIASLIVGLEGLKECLAGLVEVALGRVHFPANLLNEGDRARMRDCILHRHCLVVAGPERFGIL